MTDHDRLSELCAGHVLGSLDAEDRERLQRHLEDDGPRCVEEIAKARDAVLALGQSCGSEEPDPSVREKLLERIRRTAQDDEGGQDNEHGREQDDEDSVTEQPWRDWQSDSAPSTDMFFLAKGEGQWEPTTVEGVTVRRLFVDVANNRMTAMFRMAPGTAYVPHVHAGYEECYVLEGDLKVGDTVMTAGDYQRAAEGSVHGVQSTENGCLLLISSSLSDEAA